MIQHPRQQLIVLWMIWFSMLVAVLIYQFALGPGIPSGANARSEGANPIILLAGGLLVVASAIRWILIPRAAQTGRGGLRSSCVGWFGAAPVCADAGAVCGGRAVGVGDRPQR